MIELSGSPTLKLYLPDELEELHTIPSIFFDIKFILGTEFVFAPPMVTKVFPYLIPITEEQESPVELHGRLKVSISNSAL